MGQWHVGDGDSAMSGRDDRTMILGVVALRLGYVERTRLLAALREWSQSDSLALDDLLINRAQLSPARLALLSPIAAEHLQQHQHNMESALEALDGLALLSEVSGRSSASMTDSTASHEPSELSTKD